MKTKLCPICSQKLFAEMHRDGCVFWHCDDCHATTAFMNPNQSSEFFKGQAGSRTVLKGGDIIAEKI